MPWAAVQSTRGHAAPRAGAPVAGLRPKRGSAGPSHVASAACYTWVVRSLWRHKTKLEMGWVLITIIIQNPNHLPDKSIVGYILCPPLCCSSWSLRSPGVFNPGLPKSASTAPPRQCIRVARRWIPGSPPYHLVPPRVAAASPCDSACLGAHVGHVDSAGSGELSEK